MSGSLDDAIAAGPAGAMPAAMPDAPVAPVAPAGPVGPQTFQTYAPRTVTAAEGGDGVASTNLSPPDYARLQAGLGPVAPTLAPHPPVPATATEADVPWNPDKPSVSNNGAATVLAQLRGTPGVATDAGETPPAAPVPAPSPPAPPPVAGSLDAAIAAGPTGDLTSSTPTKSGSGLPITSSLGAGFLTDAGRIAGTVAGQAYAGALSIPRSIAQLADWSDSKLFPGSPLPTLDSIVGAIPDPSHPGQPAFPTYQQAKDEWFNSTGGTEYAPTNTLAKAALAAGSMALTGGFSGLAEGAGLALAGRAGEALPAVATAARTMPGLAASGAGSQVAQDAAQKYLPGNQTAAVVAGLVGGGLPVLAHAGAAALRTTPEQSAVKELFGGATDPAAAKAALADPASDELVPGSPVTLGQLTNDAGIQARENYARDRTPDAFRTIANQQNAAVTNALGTLADPAATAAQAGQFFRNRMDGLTAAENSNVETAQRGAEAAQSPDAIGGAGTPEQAGAAIQGAVAQHYGPALGQAADAEGVAAGRASAALDALGGVQNGTDQASALQQYGQSLKAPLTGTLDTLGANERRLWDAVDPTGTLAMDVTPIKQAAAGVIGDMIPRAGDTLSTDEAPLLNLPGTWPAVDSFRAVAALRKNVTDAMRKARMPDAPSGAAQSLRRLTILQGAIDDAMAQAVENQVSRESSAVADGRMAAGDTIMSRLSGITDADQHASAGVAAGNVASRNAQEVPGMDAPRQGGARGADSTTGRGPDGSAGSPGLSGPIRSKRQVAKPQSLLSFIVSHGGMQDESGELAAMDAGKGRVGLVRKSGGLTFDYMREKAEEAGYLPPGSGVNDLLNAIDTELRGNKVYRPDQAPLALSNSMNDADRRYAARDDVHVMQEHLGVRLTKDEVDHAAGLVLQGVHPEDAIHQATRATMETELDNNASRHAFGRLLGVPPEAEQATLGVSSEPALTPNFDAEAADRYRTARAATVAKKDMQRAPGVGPVLASGPTYGTFKMADSDVPAALLGSGKKLPERVQAFLQYGGSPATATDYLAFDLRSKAGNPDGTLNPGAFHRWTAANREALSQLPGAADRFATLGEAQRQLADIQTARGALQKQFEAASGDTPASAIGQYWQPGPKGGEAMDRLMTASGNSPVALAAASERAAQTLRNEVIRDGEFKQGNYAAWKQKYGPALSRLPEDVRARFDNVAAARETVIKSMADRDAKLAAYQASAARFWLHREPEDAVAAAFRSANPTAEFRDMMQQAGNDQAAVAGIRRAVLDHVLDRGTSNVEAGNTGAMRIKSATLQNLLDKHAGALAQVFTAEQMDLLGRVAKDLQRANRTVAGSAPLIGPGTATGLMAASRYAAHGTLLGTVVRALGKAAAVGAGAYFGEAEGALAVSAGADAAKEIIGSLRGKRTGTVERLITQAILDPKQGRLLLAKATPESLPSIASRFAKRAIQSGVVTAH